MKLVLTINIDPERIKNQRDASKVLQLIACDVEQGLTGGFIRNNETGEEKDRWTVDITR